MGDWVVGFHSIMLSIRPDLHSHTFMTGKRSSRGDDAAAESVTSPNKILRTEPTAASVAVNDVEMAAATASMTARISLREEIQLTDKETQLFEFLLDVEKQYDCKAVLRVAGGWVRDKLLGRESDDVDIVLDTMTGKQFADLINAYEDDHGHKKHPVGIIKANPDQSKHLETATMQLGDIGWVDFVNLRAETYSDEHRIPDVEFGTPLQDAERRDFTINSLFYNISERKIEDFTERGIEDLRIGLIRTPLDPRVTFMDDPLRVLRAVRFASRFNFELNDDLRAAAKSEQVKDALIKKVSRERVGKELLGMLTGSSAHPERALKMLHDLGLCKSIFLPPLAQPIYDPAGVVVEDQGHFDVALWERGYAYAAAMFNLVVERTGRGSLDVAKMGEDEQNALKLRIFSAFFLPLAEHYLLIKKRQQWLPVHIIRESLKLRNRDAEDVGNVILSNVKVFSEHVQPGVTFDRVRVGLLLREVGALWELCSDVSLVNELVAATSEESRQEIRTRYAAFAATIVSSGLDGVWDLKPLLNGKELIKEVGVTPGPALKQTLDRIIVWQLENPNATRDECLAFVRREVTVA